MPAQNAAAEAGRAEISVEFGIQVRRVAEREAEQQSRLPLGEQSPDRLADEGSESLRRTNHRVRRRAEPAEGVDPHLDRDALLA